MILKDSIRLYAGGVGSGRHKEKEVEPLSKDLLKRGYQGVQQVETFFKVGPSGYPLNTPRSIINVMRVEGKSMVPFRTDEISKVQPSKVYATQNDVDNRKIRSIMKSGYKEMPNGCNI